MVPSRQESVFLESGWISVTVTFPESLGASVVHPWGTVTPLPPRVSQGYDPSPNPRKSRSLPYGAREPVLGVSDGGKEESGPDLCVRDLLPRQRGRTAPSSCPEPYDRPRSPCPSYPHTHPVAKGPQTPLPPTESRVEFVHEEGKGRKGTGGREV